MSYLRAVVHHAKIYIRPMQRNLSLDAVKEEVRVKVYVTIQTCIIIICNNYI